MKSFLLNGFFAAILLCSTVAFAQSDKEAVSREGKKYKVQEALFYPGLSTFVDTAINTQMTAMDIPAASVAIVKDGKVLIARGYGVKDHDTQAPVTADTMFRPGSISKLFTWTAVMQMVEAGKLELDADVNAYLDTFQIPATFDEPITLRHILTHTAGFEEGFLGYLFVNDPTKVPPLKEALKKYLPRRINKPGAYSAYSNYATALAGLIVENVSGLPFNDYVRAHIFEPLKMEHSTFVEPLPDDLEPFFAGGFKRKAGIYEKQEFEVIANVGPAGALSASANDMARFMLAYLEGGQLDNAQILTPETVAQTLSQLYTPDPRIAGMAHGFYENTINGHRLVGHGGDTLLFHSNLMLNPDEKLGIYVSYMGAKGGQARGEFLQIFYDRYYPKPLEQLTVPEDFADRAERYAGSYKFWRHNQSTLEKVVTLTGGITVKPTPDNSLLLSGFGQARQFVEIGDNLFRQVDGPRIIAFGEDADGNINDLYVDGIVFMSASRTPTLEAPLFSAVIPALSFAVFMSVWAGWIYRRKEFKTMEASERNAIRLSLGMSGVNIAFIAIFAVILASYGESIALAVPLSLKLALWLPDLASIIALAVGWFAVQAWRKGYWRLGRRIHYSLVALSGLFMSWFYYYWNFLGVQIAA